jgi:hypothetical protein
MNYNIKISKIIKYLQHKGWTIQDYGNLAYKISIISKSEEFDIIIPKKETLPDYEFRVEQLIKSLSSIEGRNIDDIRGEIENIGFDVLKFRFVAEIKLVGQYAVIIALPYIGYLFYNSNILISVILIETGLCLAIAIVIDEISFKNRRNQAPWNYGNSDR